YSYVCVTSLELASFPTRRSSGLARVVAEQPVQRRGETHGRLREPHADDGVRGVEIRVVQRHGTGSAEGIDERSKRVTLGCPVPRDRKSTRLNSSHVKISYAVFYL